MLRRIPAVAALLAFCLVPPSLRPQAPAETPGAPKGTMLLTIFLRHDESKTLDEINAHLKQTGSTRTFPRREWRWSPGT